MTKLNKVLILLAALQLGILVASRAWNTKQVEKPSSKTLLTLDKDAIQQIEIIDDEGKKALLKKQSAGVWKLANAGDYPVKKTTIEEFVNKLKSLKSTQLVTSKPEHRHRLEVAKDKFQRRVTVSLSDGKTRTFFLGSSPLLRKVHLRFDDDDRVFLAGDLSAWDAGTSASTWVETSYFKADREDIVALELRNGQGEFRLVKGDGGWKITSSKPAEGQAEELDQTQVDSLLSSAASVTLQTPVGQEDKPEYGLDKPTATLLLQTQRKRKTKGKQADKAENEAAPRNSADKGKTGVARADASKKSDPAQLITRKLRLRIGAKIGEDYYAKSDDSPYVIRINNWTAETFTKKKISDLLKKEEDKPEGAQVGVDSSAGSPNDIPG